MIETSKHDTPINRASIAQFDINEAQQFIERIRERRFNAYKLYQLGLRAKEEKQHGKTMEALDKRLEQFIKPLRKRWSIDRSSYHRHIDSLNQFPVIQPC